MENPQKKTFAIIRSENTLQRYPTQTEGRDCRKCSWNDALRLLMMLTFHG